MSSLPGPCSPVCRICLAVDLPTVMLSGTPLQDVFEKVTNIPLHTDDMRPVEACLFCCSQLKKSWKLLLTSIKSENILTEISERCNVITKESISLVNCNANGLQPALSISILECTDNLLPEKAENIVIKLEKQDEGSLHQEEVDVSDINVGEWDSDDDDLPLNSLKKAEEINVKLEDTEAPSPQNSVTIVENQIGTEQKLFNTNTCDAPINFLKPSIKTQCNICERWYENKYIEKHIMTHTDKRAFKCKVCMTKFSFIHSLRRHIKNIHEQSRSVIRKIYSCNFCVNTFKTRAQYFKHTRTHTYLCDYCQQPYKQKAHLIQHLKKHTGKKSYKCSICSVPFNNTYHLNRHCRISHNAPAKIRKPPVKNQIYKCSMCVGIFFSRRDYSKHVKSSHIYKCNDCTQTFDNKRYLAQHVMIHMGSYECTVCHIPFKNKVFLMRHNRHVHKISLKRVLVKCDLCGSQFNKRSALEKHVRMHRYKCDHCQKEFQLKANLINHLKIHNEEKVYACTICQWRFNHKGNLMIHLKSHDVMTLKKYECDLCHRRYSAKDDLIKHLQTHTAEKPFECDVCHKRYTSKRSLKSHKLIHTPEKSVECEFCQKLFRTTAQLTNHRRTHTGEKPYECTLCDRRYAHRTILNIHVRSHTGEKPYKCKICPARFADSSKLRLHSVKHGELLPAACDMCHRRFAKKHQLAEHYRSHTGEKPFTCGHCNGRFMTKRTLNKHLKTRICRK